MFLAFALAGFVTCEWLLALNDPKPNEGSALTQEDDDSYRIESTIDSTAAYPGSENQGMQDSSSHWDT